MDYICCTFIFTNCTFSNNTASYHGGPTRMAVAPAGRSTSFCNTNSPGSMTVPALFTGKHRAKWWRRRHLHLDRTDGRRPRLQAAPSPATGRSMTRTMGGRPRWRDLCWRHLHHVQLPHCGQYQCGWLFRRRRTVLVRGDGRERQRRRQLVGMQWRSGVRRVRHGRQHRRQLYLHSRANPEHSARLPHRSIPAQTSTLTATLNDNGTCSRLRVL